MLDWITKKFHSTSKLMLAELIGSTEPEVETYEDMVVMDYTLPVPKDMDDVMNILEDRADMQIFYLAEKESSDSIPYHMCAVCIPSGNYMYKVFAQCEKGSLVTNMTVTLFSSLDQMSNSLIADQNVHEQMGFTFEYLMDNGTYGALFCL